MLLYRGVFSFIFLLSFGALAAEKESKKDPEQNKKEPEVLYQHEAFASALYRLNTGNFGSANAAKKNNFATTDMSFQLQYGFLANDNTEPIAEVGYSSSTGVVDDYKSTERYIDWGVGILYNLPIMVSPNIQRTNKEPNTTLFSAAKLIPYGGVIISSRSALTSGANGTSTSSDNSDLVTKIVGGIRFMVLQHVAINSSIRFYYLKSSGIGTATGADSTGGSAQRLGIEARMLGLSFLF